MAIKKSLTENYLNFHLELNAANIRYTGDDVWRRKRRLRDPAMRETLRKDINSFVNRCILEYCRPGCLRSQNFTNYSVYRNAPT